MTWGYARVLAPFCPHGLRLTRIAGRQGPLVLAFALGAIQLLVRHRALATVTPTFEICPALQMGKINFGCVLGWSVVFFVTIHWVISLILPQTQARSMLPLAVTIIYPGIPRLTGRQPRRAGCGVP